MIRIDALKRTLQAETAASDFWNKLSQKEKKAYLQAHPKSKYGKGGAGTGVAPAAKSSSFERHAADTRRALNTLGGVGKIMSKKSIQRWKKPVSVRDVHIKLVGLGYKRIGSGGNSIGGNSGWRTYKHANGNRVVVDTHKDAKLAHGASILKSSENKPDRGGRGGERIRSTRKPYAPAPETKVDKVPEHIHKAMTDNGFHYQGITKLGNHHYENMGPSNWGNDPTPEMIANHKAQADKVVDHLRSRGFSEPDKQGWMHSDTHKIMSTLRHVKTGSYNAHERHMYVGKK